MASSGSFGTGNYHGRYLTFNWWTNGRSIDGNYTDIGWNLVGSGNASASWYKAGNFKVRHEGFYFRLLEEHTFYPNGLVYGSKKHKWNAMYIERVI